jgi:endonuclease-3
MAATDHLGEIERLLDETHGPRKLTPDGDPVATLVATILSQNTSDTNTARAFASLRQAYQAWQEVIDADTGDVVDAIRSGGLANRKGPRIQLALQALKDRFGSISLSSLETMDLDDARSELLAIDGVGPKTAACVLLFSLGKPALPVDTHVFRVASRLGLVETGTTAEQAHAKLEAMIGDDPQRTYRFHVELIQHGRTICRARVPACGRCVLRSYCAYAANSA